MVFYIFFFKELREDWTQRLILAELTPQPLHRGFLEVALLGHVEYDIL